MNVREFDNIVEALQYTDKSIDAGFIAHAWNVVDEELGIDKWFVTRWTKGEFLNAF